MGYAQGNKTNKQRASLIRKKGYSKKMKTKNKIVSLKILI